MNNFCRICSDTAHAAFNKVMMLIKCFVSYRHPIAIMKQFVFEKEISIAMGAGGRQI